MPDTHNPPLYQEARNVLRCRRGVRGNSRREFLVDSVCLHGERRWNEGLRGRKLFWQVRADVNEANAVGMDPATIWLIFQLVRAWLKFMRERKQ